MERMRVLHVEDNPDHALLIRRSLERQDPDLEIIAAASAEEALGVLDGEGIDVVLCDYALGGGMNGLDLLDIIRDRDARLPYVLLTGQGNEEVAADALRRGANDYIVKRSGSLSFNRLALILRNQRDMYYAHLERDAAERRALVSEEKFQLVFEQANEAIFLNELDGRILEANPAASLLTGFSLEELQAMNVQDLHTPAERYISENELNKARQGDFQGFVATGRCKDGTLKKCAVTGSLVQWGDRQLMLSLVTEIAETTGPPSLEEIEKRIAAEADARFKMAVEQAPLIAVQGYDTDGRVTFWNRASEELYGFNSSEVLGKTLDKLILGEEETRVFLAQLRRVRDDAVPSPAQEWSTRDRWGNERWVYSTMFPLIEEGECHEVFCIDLDITPRRQLEAELRARNEDLEAFAHTVSHDLRAPLSSMDGYAHLLREAAAEKLSLEEEEYLERIIKSSENMERLIASMLEFARSGHQAQNPEFVDLEAVTREIWMELEGKHKVRDARLETSFAVPEAYSDPVLLKQVLYNLLDNAVKFNAGADAPLVAVGSLATGDEITISVEDNGPGIPPEERETVFAPFKRLAGHTPGLGIGLSMVKRAVDSWGGRVWVESSPGAGTTFSFTIPVKPGIA